jgi:hypothetical protein
MVIVELLGYDGKFSIEYGLMHTRFSKVGGQSRRVTGIGFWEGCLCSANMRRQLGL